MTDETEKKASPPTHYHYLENEAKNGKTYRSQIGFGYDQGECKGVENTFTAQPVNGRFKTYTAEERQQFLKGKSDRSKPAQEKTQSRDRDDEGLGW